MHKQVLNHKITTIVRPQKCYFTRAHIHAVTHHTDTNTKAHALKKPKDFLFVFFFQRCLLFFLAM